MHNNYNLLESAFITKECRIGEGFPHQTRKFSVGTLTDFRECPISRFYFVGAALLGGPL